MTKVNLFQMDIPEQCRESCLFLESGTFGFKDPLELFPCLDWLVDEVFWGRTYDIRSMVGVEWNWDKQAWWYRFDKDAVRGQCSKYLDSASFNTDEKIEEKVARVYNNLRFLEACVNKDLRSWGVHFTGAWDSLYRRLEIALPPVTQAASLELDFRIKEENAFKEPSEPEDFSWDLPFVCFSDDKDSSEDLSSKPPLEQTQYLHAQLFAELIPSSIMLSVGDEEYRIGKQGIKVMRELFVDAGYGDGSEPDYAIEWNVASLVALDKRTG